MTITDPNDFLLASGVPSFKFDTIGTTAKGQIISLDMMQQKDFTSGALLTWEDGRPKMQLRIVLATDQRDPEINDDNGHRAIYIRGQAQQAVRDAIKAAGASKIEVGGTLAVRYDSDGEPPKKGLNAPKQYKAKYEAPAAQTTAVDPEDLF
jgi:hypothetical protein